MGRSRACSTVALVLSLAAIAIMVASLWPTADRAVTEAERADHIASRIRCPFCNGESIAEATSQVARDLHAIIEEQVASGRTDDEVYAYFADRYGETLLLSPPLLGWGWALWVLPLAALGAGALVIGRRRRSPTTGFLRIDGALEEARVQAQLEAAESDQAEIAQQVVLGELEPEAAGVLTAVLEKEVDQLTAALEHPAGDGVPDGRSVSSRRRAIAGTLTVVLAIIVVAVTLLLTSNDERAGEGIVGAPPIDFASVTSDRLEEVVAANPDIVPMRLGLANMLLQEGEVLRAAEHYGEVLAREQHPEAMASLGWISYLAGEHETAEGFLVDALSLVPDYPQAHWWLANVRLVGLNDPGGAVEPLKTVLAASAIPDDIRQLAEEMLRLAEDAS